jgi:hypothetical protein
MALVRLRNFERFLSVFYTDVLRKQSADGACERFGASHHHLCRLLVYPDLGAATHAFDCWTGFHLGLQELDHTAVGQHCILVALDKPCEVALCGSEADFEFSATHLCALEEVLLGDIVFIHEAEHTHTRSQPEIVQLLLMCDEPETCCVVPAISVADVEHIYHGESVPEILSDSLRTVEQYTVGRDVDNGPKGIDFGHMLGHSVQTALCKFLSQAGQMV